MYMKSAVSCTRYCEVVSLVLQTSIMGNSNGEARYPTRSLHNTPVEWCNAGWCLKIIFKTFWMSHWDSPHSQIEWCKSLGGSVMSKRLPYEFDSINSAPPSHSLQLSANFKMDHISMDYRKMTDNRMDYDSQYVCHLCDISFSKAANLKRHMDSKHALHNARKLGHTCGEYGKGFSRKDILKRHLFTCQALRFKCPRCHRILKEITSLTRHMGLCPIPTCGMCQEQFVELDQLREHQKSHRKRKAPSDPLTHKLKKQNCEGWFHCPVGLDCFPNREELFHHRLDHMDDARAYRPVEPHFDFEDEKLNVLLGDNAALIFSHHRFSPVSADFNFPLTLSLKQDGWLNEIYQTLDLVTNISYD